MKNHRNNIFFDDINSCPYHPNAELKKFRKISTLRKPGNLMIKQLRAKWHTERNNSFMIGDQVVDKICAQKSNLYFEFAKNNFFLQVKNILKKFNNY